MGYILHFTPEVALTDNIHTHYRMISLGVDLMTNKLGFSQR
jgi:hypothetical protein